jgi:hypothetical protein
MGKRAVAGLALAAGVCAGCTHDPAPRCPQPVVYDDATLKQIQAAITALPPDSILHRVMEDYENERDDLRFCR